jgi:hypothetical protein
MVVLQLGRVPFFIGPTLHESAPPLTRDYLSMAEWVRANSEPDALFHLSSLDGSLRYYGQRSVLAVREEWIYGMYTGIDPLRLRNQETQLILGRTDTQTLLRALQQAQADYLITGPEQARPFNADSAIVYQNPTYTIYRVAAIPAEQSPLAQFPALYAAYQAYRPPWEGNAVLFNPATGNVAVRQSILEEVGRSAAQTWDEATLQSLHLLTQMRFEAELGLPAEAAALIGEWRNDKEASLVAQAGVDYLVVESEWLGFLSAPEYQALTTSPGYEWVGEWPIGPRRYFLYRVQP